MTKQFLQMGSLDGAERNPGSGAAFLPDFVLLRPSYTCLAPRLASLAADMPRQAVECLRLMIEGDKEGWGILGWREHARTILTTAIQSSDPKARQAAVDLVHRLGARGYFEFRDLLQEGPSS